MAHKHSVYDTDKHFSIDPISRVITNQSPNKIMIMQGDHNSERFTFELPRYVEGHDMSKCDKTKVHFININAQNKAEKSFGPYEVDDLQVSSDSEDVVIFSWLLSGAATMYHGTLAFLVEFTCMTNAELDYSWHTARHTSISVGEGMDNGPELFEKYYDVLAEWERRVFDAASGKSAYEYAKDGGYTGTEKEFAAKMAQENPTMEQFSKLANEKISTTQLNNAVNEALTQAKESGDFKGEKGDPGYTPQKGVDYFDGKDGNGISHAQYNNSDGTLEIRMDDGKTVKTEDLRGKAGVDGKSVTVTNVTESEVDGGYNVVEFSDGKRVIIKNGSKGADGEDGYTPRKGVDYFDGTSATHSWNGTTLSITSASGTTSANLKGAKGDAGYSPVKGKDYFDGNDGADGNDGLGLYYSGETFPGVMIGFTRYLALSAISLSGRTLVIGDMILTADGLLWKVTDDYVSSDGAIYAECISNLRGATDAQGFSIYYSGSASGSYEPEIGESLILDNDIYVSDRPVIEGDLVITSDGRLWRITQYTQNYEYFTASYVGNIKGDVGEQGYSIYYSKQITVLPIIGQAKRLTYADIYVSDQLLKNGDLVVTADGYLWKLRNIGEEINTGVTDVSGMCLGCIKGAKGDAGSVVSVNGISPDENGNVQIEVSGGSGSGVDVTAKVGQMIVVKEVDENGKPTAWEAVDRTHWSEGGIVEILPETTISAENSEADMKALPSLGLVLGNTYVVKLNGVEYSCTAFAFDNDGATFIALGNTIVGGGEDNGIPFLLADVPADVAVVIGMNVMIEPMSEDITLPMVLSIYNNNEVVHKLDPKFLPDGVPFVEEGEIVEILPECQPVYDEDELFVLNTDSGLTFVVGDIYVVNWNGTKYECVAYDFPYKASGVMLGNLAEIGIESNNEPFIIVYASGIMMVTPLDDITSLSISIDHKERTVRKLKPECLPDGVINEALYIKASGMRTDDGVDIATHNFEDIKGAIVAGKAIFFVDMGCPLPLVYTNEDEGIAQFRNVYYDGANLCNSYVTIEADGKITALSYGEVLNLN